MKTIKTKETSFFIFLVSFLSLLFFAIPFSGEIRAEEDGYVWSDWRTIERLYPHNDSFIIILSGDPMSTVITNPYCQSRLYIHKNDENYAAKVSTLQLIYGLQDQIQVHYDEAGIEPDDGFIRFDRFQTRVNSE